MAPTASLASITRGTELESQNTCGTGDLAVESEEGWKVVTRRKRNSTPRRNKVNHTISQAFSDQVADRRYGRSKFWTAHDNDASEDEEVKSTTPTIKEFLQEATAAGYKTSDLLEAEEQLVMAQIEVNSTPNLYPRKCPLADELIDSIVNRKTPIKPWKGPLPPPQISPLRTIGDAPITNVKIYSKGKRLPPPSFKTVLVSTNSEKACNGNSQIASIQATVIPIPMAQNCSGKMLASVASGLVPIRPPPLSQQKRTIQDSNQSSYSLPRNTQIQNGPGKYSPSKLELILIRNGKSEAWFYPSAGLNELFGRAGKRRPDIKMIHSFP
jgi:hypothetical protein